MSHSNGHSRHLNLVQLETASPAPKPKQRPPAAPRKEPRAKAAPLWLFLVIGFLILAFGACIGFAIRDQAPAFPLPPEPTPSQPHAEAQ